MYTSGTTGEPKGVVLSHRNMVYAGRAVVAAHALPRATACFRRCRSTTSTGSASPRCAGHLGRQHRDATSLHASQWWPLVERYRPSGSTWYRRSSPICSTGRISLAPGRRLPRHPLRPIASAPLPPEQHQAFEARFGIGMVEAMGLTEAASVAFANPLDPARRSTARRPSARRRSAGRRRDGSVLGHGRAGRDSVARRERHGGLLREPELTAQGARREAGSPPAISVIATRRLLFRHRPAEGADHQGRREHRAARDRRGVDAASGRPRGRGGGDSRSRTTVRTSLPASSSSPARAATRPNCERIAGATRSLQDAALAAPGDRAAEGAVGQGAAAGAAGSAVSTQRGGTEPGVALV